MQVKKLAALLLVVTLMVTGCAMLRADATPQDRYDEALASWNSVMKEYRLQYAMQTPATQGRWDKIFAIPLYEAGTALGAWSGTLEDVTKEKAFFFLKDQAVRLLLQYQVIEIKE
jgi:hypothetical protein